MKNNVFKSFMKLLLFITVVYIFVVYLFTMVVEDNYLKYKFDDLINYSHNNSKLEDIKDYGVRNGFYINDNGFAIFDQKDDGDKIFATGSISGGLSYEVDSLPMG